MKLILTSTDFLTPNSRNIILKELGNVSNCKLLFIPNENVTQDKINSNKYYDRMVEYGFKKENIVIFNYMYPDKYKNLEIDAIYIGGGNTFAILKMLKDTKFDKSIINYVNNGVIYVGGSAGTHVVTKSIEHVKDFDSNFVNLKDYDGLSLYDGIIICHYDSNREYIYNSYKNKYRNIIKLKDDEVMIYQDEK